MTFFNWTPGEGEMLLSPYIWIYVVGTAIFTCLTLGSWYYYGRYRQHHPGKNTNTSHNDIEDGSSADVNEKEAVECVQEVESCESTTG